MMSENQFWDLISEAKTSTGSAKEIPDWLEGRLSQLPEAEIIDFAAWLATFMDRSNDEKLWAAATMVAGGLSDDGFVYFQCWLIAQGKDVYESVLVNPDILARLKYSENGMFGPCIELEKLLYVSSEARWRKLDTPRHTKLDLPIGYTPPPGSHPERTQRKNVGFLKVKDPELAALFPKLTERFRNLMKP